MLYTKKLIILFVPHIESKNFHKIVEYMKSFKIFFTRQDNFSQPYKINYKGKAGKKTLLGALLT